MTSQTRTAEPAPPSHPGPAAPRPRGAAPRLLALLEPLLGGPSPVRLRAWDGSVAGPADAPVVVLRSRRALRRLLWQPNELGLAQAYVTGDLDLEGDLGEGLRALWRAAGSGLRPPRPGLPELARAGLTAARLGALGPRPPAPEQQARLHGARHTRSRDRAAISHHYDLSNDFYRLLLDDTMAYSCGYWTSDSPGYTGEHAQRDKLELICAKLALGPGSRLLDVGCGWGSLTLHAAERHGAWVHAITLSEQQAAHVREQVRLRGLEGMVEVELRDYRDLERDEAGGYDAVTSIEMGEHVGDENYPQFAALLHRMLRPRGRLLLQQMSRGANAPGGGAFIETYIAPDMHMRPVGETAALLERAGFEVREVQAMREHYVRTVAAWHETLERRWSEVVALVGEATARVWRLYLIGGGLSFEQGRMGVDQILAVRPAPDGDSGLPGPTRTWHAS